MKRLTSLFLFLMVLSCLWADTPPDTLWTRTFGGTGNDTAGDVLQTNDGGYLLAGRSDTLNDAWIVKTDDSGIEEWSNSYDFHSISSIQQTDDNGFVFSGSGDYGNAFQLVKITEDGSVEWNQAYTCFEEGDVSCVQTTYDGGYILAGTVYEGNNVGDYGLLKTDSLGNLEWFQQFGIPGQHDWELAYSVKQTVDEGYILAGYIYRIGAGTNDAWLVKTDSLGNEEWNHYYGGEGHDCANDVLQLNGNGYIFTGWTRSYGAGGRDAWLVKIDENGIIEWDQTYGGLLEDKALSLQKSAVGDYIMAGTSESFSYSDYNLWVVKTDALGNEYWHVNYGGYGIDGASAVKVTTDGNYIVAGSASSFGADDSDFWLVRLVHLTGNENDFVTDSNVVLSNHPNPFNPTTTISFTAMNAKDAKVEIFNVKGQHIVTLSDPSMTDSIEGRQTHSVTWNGDDDFGKPVSSGIYYYKLNINGKTEAVKKCLLLK